MTNAHEYGSRGRIGIAVPQANPIVEVEVGACLPKNVSMHATRLTSEIADQRSRFIGYFEDLGTTLRSYDTLSLDAVGFACTASSYLVGHTREMEVVANLSARHGYPIITGGKAILDAVTQLGAHRVAIAAPYPEFVLKAAREYLESAEIEIVDKVRVATRTNDTRTIYELHSDDAIAAAERLNLNRVQCLLFTGTGMPSLRAIDLLGSRTGLPILSTNLCLAWALCRTIGIAGSAGGHPLINGWQTKLSDL